MKSHKLMWLLCSALCFAVACKKNVTTSENSDNLSAVNSQSSSQEQFSAANFLFVNGINNPYLPLVPGTVFYFINTINDKSGTSYQHIYVTVTSDIKKILGVNCEVVHDQVKENGKVTEDTYDWYAQDRFGNVWYFGEGTKALTDTGWSTEGSWQAGVHNAVPGIAMFANPGAHIGLTYYQEFQRGVAEDQAKVLSVNSNATVAYGAFSNCVETEESTRLDRTDIEHKFYAKGVGQVLTTSATEREELISVKHN
jgi:hypothetical protein